MHALRDELRYTVTSAGCETSMGETCTVHMDGNTGESCTVLAVRANDSTITTVEGAAEDIELHPTQESFQEEHGPQCGCCTSGTMMTAKAYSGEESEPEHETIRHALKGNLCRGTGYQNIVSAVESAAEQMGDARGAN